MGKKIKVNVVEYGGHLYVGTPDSEWVVGDWGRVRQGDLPAVGLTSREVEVEIPDPPLKGGETGKLFGHDVVAVKGLNGKYCWRFVHACDTVVPGDRSFDDVVRD